MKKLFILFGLFAMIFAMTSCRKVCDCTVVQRDVTINNYLREKDDGVKKCSEMNSLVTNEDGSESGVHCE